MFKYVWIIMLVIAAMIFIGYTIYAIYDSYMSATLYKDDDCDIKWLLSETFEYLWLTHDAVSFVWIVIFLSTICGTFLFSLIAYGSSIGSGG